jgi:putative membrane protein
VNRIVKSLRYTIAGTPDGVRVGYGLLSTSNETLPPGRIHSISISQELLWRPADWWEVKVNRAGKSSAQGAAGQQNTTILPVGTRADVFRVLELVLPGLVNERTKLIVEAGLAKASEGDGFTNSPRRAAILRWFSWRRNGFALTPDAAILRRGAIWRELVVVPAARLQSISVSQGPVYRAMRLGRVHAHTVSGPISAGLGALDVADVETFFRELSETAVAAAAADRSHRWRSGA